MISDALLNILNIVSIIYYMLKGRSYTWSLCHMLIVNYDLLKILGKLHEILKILSIYFAISRLDFIT